ncbi:uncharacterized protein RHOBADRAFT_52189 [Rhodotorula graminis WP1]|uniref:Ubiquitin carboxyl-terminal hydrolase n=1 Tax=Rhodotorula graminis (strain WP1) TaxID=578459 RepID=A0A194S9W7_RHOGW|nr:uncharacterized protein RHOBADRAFT_52189 [Rhodotorula graminis WP1]KPV77255.1 hypothetical protein RHOBADRAFT_52189 [Rhodotorula graminis WP1]
MAVAAHQPVRTLHTDHLRDSPKLPQKSKRSSDHHNSLAALTAARPITLASLLEHPVEFVHASTNTRDDVVPYVPINAPKPAPASVAKLSNGSTHGSPVASTSKAPHAPPGASANSTDSPTPARASAVFPVIDTSVGWARKHPVGAGLQNMGNTCFLNSALQVLLHTPPLVRYLEGQGHSHANCVMVQKKGWCMTCAMKMLVKQSFAPGKRSYQPKVVVNHLKGIARHFRIGRQEDSHEFLRFFIDAMAATALAGKSPKLEQKVKETTFIHQLFGGRLRSRVHCLACEHNSDTFDSILDLSLDLAGGRANSLKDALENLVRKDKLTGQNKYKCEKCKKLVNAEKNFTIDEAPLVLTIHLKRFTPTGRKLAYPLKYPEQLKLGPYMSSVNSDSGPSYRLYGLILHSGSGPHSGHYTSYVRAADERWYDMNDDFVSPVPGGKAPLGERNAYVLFYIRERGDALRQAVNGAPAAAGVPSKVNGGGGGASGKRPRDSLASQNGAVASPAQSPAAKRARASPDAVRRSSSPPVPVRIPFVTGPQPPQVATASSPAASPAQARSPQAQQKQQQQQQQQQQRKQLVKLPVHGALGRRQGHKGGKKVRPEFGGVANKPRVIQG